MKVTLAKALKMKNQLVKEVADHLNKVKLYNSYLSTNHPNFEAKEEYEAYRRSLAKLIFLKAEIAKANTLIHIHIISIAELKGLISQLREINTREGKETVNGGYGQAPREVEYMAIYSDKDVDSFVKEAEKEIETRQDEIDKFNHSTSIEVE